MVNLFILFFILLLLLFLVDENTPLVQPHNRVRQPHSYHPSRPSFSSNALYTSIDQETAIFQASVFIDDAVHYRSIHHKIDAKSLRLYRIYHSLPVQIFLSIVIIVVLVLAFFEYPTSLSVSSDFRFRNRNLTCEPPCGVTESIEVVCLLIFLLNWIVQFYLVGRQRFIRQPWLVVYAFMVLVSFIDLSISLAFCVSEGQDSLGATIRIRRFFRPFFFIVPSSIMKKFIKAVFRTLRRIWSVFVLLMLHIYVFAMVGMLVFPPPFPPSAGNNSNGTNTGLDEVDNAGLEAVKNDSGAYFAAVEGQRFFGTVEDALVNLLVFLTTANNPDFMTPIYQFNRYTFLYFFFFLSIGLYLILNLFTAAIFTEFRGFLEQSMQSSFVRRRVGFRAAFAVLVRNSGGRKEEAGKDLVRQLLQRSNLPSDKKPEMMAHLETVNRSSECINWEEFRSMLDLVSREDHKKTSDNIQYYSHFVFLRSLQKLVRHPLFNYFTLAMTLIHVAILTIEMEADQQSALSNESSVLAHINFFFFLYYTAEQLLKMTGLGLREFFTTPANIFDFVITLAIFFTELVILAKFGFPFIQYTGSEPGDYSTAIRVMNVFIVFRLLRVIPMFDSVYLVIGTMFEILKNLRAFAGIFVVIYYVFALLGMELFQNNTALDTLNDGNPFVNKCGSYENLGYFAYNFHDFASSLVILWNVMVVNNWYVFLDAFSRATNKWSQLYFIAWWLVSVIVTINLFVSLVLEVFLTRWETYHRKGGRETPPDLLTTSTSTQSLLSTQSDVRVILRKSLREPPDNELLHQIHRHNEIL